MENINSVVSALAYFFVGYWIAYGVTFLEPASVLTEGNGYGQFIGTALGVVVALIGGVLVYGVLKATVGIRLSQEEYYYGADLSVHKIGAVSQD